MEPEIREFVANHQKFFEYLRKGINTVEKLKKECDLSAPTIYKYLEQAQKYNLLKKHKQIYELNNTFGKFAAVNLNDNTAQIAIYDFQNQNNG